MPVIRVLLSGMNAMDAGLLRSLIERDDSMIVVAEVRDVGSMQADVERWQPHVVVAALPGDDLPAPCVGAMRRHPGLAIIAIEAMQRLAVYELRPHLEVLGEAWPGRLIAAVRSAAMVE